MAPNDPGGGEDKLNKLHSQFLVLARKGRTDLLPMWVADILLSQRISSLIFTPVSITESLVIPTPEGLHTERLGCFRHHRVPSNLNG